MQSFFDDTQQLHHPQSYFSRGQMRRPQEVPERSQAILQALSAMGMVGDRPARSGVGSDSRGTRQRLRGVFKVRPRRLACNGGGLGF